MTEINKENLLLEIDNMLIETSEAYPKNIDNDLVHINMGELSIFEKIFNNIYYKGHASVEADTINKSFKQELEIAHKILEHNIEIVLKRMIV